MDTYIIIVGTLYTGIRTIHGPFKDRVCAIEWAYANIQNQEHMIQPLIPPGL